MRFAGIHFNVQGVRSGMNSQPAVRRMPKQAATLKDEHAPIDEIQRDSKLVRLGTRPEDVARVEGEISSGVAGSALVPSALQSSGRMH